MPLRYCLLHPFKMEKYWSGNMIYICFFVEWCIIIDKRNAKTFIDLLLTNKEKQAFYERWFSKRN